MTSLVRQNLNTLWTDIQPRDRKDYLEKQAKLACLTGAAAIAYPPAAIAFAGVGIFYSLAVSCFKPKIEASPKQQIEEAFAAGEGMYNVVGEDASLYAKTTLKNFVFNRFDFHKKYDSIVDPQNHDPANCEKCKTRAGKENPRVAKEPQWMEETESITDASLEDEKDDEVESIASSSEDVRNILSGAGSPELEEDVDDPSELSRPSNPNSKSSEFDILIARRSGRMNFRSIALESAKDDFDL